MRNNIVYRQGDIILRPMRTLPKNLKVVGHRLEIVGETGNTHTLQATVLVNPVKRPIPYVQIEKGKVALITHPQHPPLEIPTGVYRVERERTFQPLIRGHESSALD